MELRLFCTAVALGATIFMGPSGSAQEFPYQIFERYLEPLAQQIGMPGLSAVILRNGRIEWERGYGHADVENKVPARTDTPYPIGGVTQAMTGVLLGICIDRHQLDVDDFIRKWVPAFPEAGATVRQVLAHAADGRFRYDSAQFTALTTVVEACSAKPYRLATAVELLDRLAMTSSAPGLDLARAEGQAARELFEPAPLARYTEVLRRVAVPYRIDSRTGRAARSEYPTYGLDAAGGLVSTAYDLARFEAAVDAGVPLSSSTLNQMWSGAVFHGVTMPTGLGWFVQTSSGARLVWTFGHIPNAGSALILKMPHKRLTLILLSNSDGLAAGYGLERGDVSASPFVKIFLRLFL
jgi:CubicO group peptidase (beta-lactamase class C family)